MKNSNLHFYTKTKLKALYQSQLFDIAFTYNSWISLKE